MRRVYIKGQAQPSKQTNAVSSLYNRKLAVSYGSIESNNTDGTTNVLLNNGFFSQKIKILSTGYPTKDPVLGGITYPPVGAQVIILHPENDINSGWILPAELDFRDSDVTSELLGGNDKSNLPGGWKKEYNQETGTLTITHENYEDLIISIDPDAGSVDIQDFQGNTFRSSSGAWEINGSDDFAVAYNDLETAFNELQTQYNSLVNILKTWTVAPGDGGLALKTAVLALNPVSVGDITTSKVDNVKFK